MKNFRLSRTVSKDDRTDNGEDESSHSEASIQEQQQKLQRVRKTRKARANSNTSRRTSETGENRLNNRNYAPEKYSDRENAQTHSAPNKSTITPKRPSSATAASRPRANTLTPQVRTFF